MSKPYMPLMVGDWIKGTRAMRAEARGVYLGLLLHQWEEGSIPSSLEELALIEPEVAKVWDTPRDRLREKFTELSTGRLQNAKLEEVRSFWAKQASNGSKGGRPPKGNPDVTQTVTQNEPKAYPKPEPLYDHDNDLDLGTRLERALDEIYLDAQAMKWSRLVDFPLQVASFKEKVRGSPDHYRGHDAGGLRLAFQHQLRNATTTKTNSHNGNPTNKKQQHTDQLIIDHARRHGKPDA